MAQRNCESRIALATRGLCIEAASCVQVLDDVVQLIRSATNASTPLTVPAASIQTYPAALSLLLGPFIDFSGTTSSVGAPDTTGPIMNTAAQVPLFHCSDS